MNRSGEAEISEETEWQSGEIGKGELKKKERRDK
jgi:hypothetical protein